jgi:Ferritin-like domain
LEDLTVSAYNGMGQLFTSSVYLRQIAEIVSVEARHAAYVRDLLSYGSFIDDTFINGLDKQQTPAEVLAALSPFLISKLDASHLPTT